MAGRTYRELMDAATLNFPFFSGIWQNQGTAAMTMVVAGTPYFARDGQTVGMRQIGVSGITSNAVIANPFDVTGVFSVEIVVKLMLLGQYIIYQIQGGGLGGGWAVYFNGLIAPGTITLLTYTAAGGGARYVTATLPQPVGKLNHIVATIDCVGLTGQIWVDNVPLASAFTNTNPPVIGTSALFLGTAAASNMLTERLRGWAGALDAAEVAALYNAYSTLTVPSRL